MAEPKLRHAEIYGNEAEGWTADWGWEGLPDGHMTLDAEREGDAVAELAVHLDVEPAAIKVRYA